MRHGIGKSSHAAGAVRRQAVSAKLIKSFATKHGEVSERFKEHAWKACVGEILPWVRIPPSPPVSLAQDRQICLIPTSLKSWSFPSGKQSAPGTEGAKCRRSCHNRVVDTSTQAWTGGSYGCGTDWIGEDGSGNREEFAACRASRDSVQPHA